MRIVFLSDTHCQLDKIEVPTGDILVHAGDFTGRGTEKEVQQFAERLVMLPHRHKFIVPGNHDFLFERDLPRAKELMSEVPGLHLLLDAGAEVDGIRIYASPWTPIFFDWAFMGDSEALRQKWEQIPNDVDVLITHGPPFGILDRCFDGTHAGCRELATAVRRIRPRLHVFGHIHEAYGDETHDGIRYLNVSTCDLRYRAVQAPVVVEV